MERNSVSRAVLAERERESEREREREVGARGEDVPCYLTLQFCLPQYFVTLG